MSAPLPARRLAAAVGVALVLLVPAATAFDSVPPGSSVHDGIVADALAGMGWPEDAVAALQEAVRRADMDESKLSIEPRGLTGAAAAYEPAHHCDRTPPTSHAEALAAAVTFVRLERGQADSFARSGQPQRALRALGSALHAAQDCFSHSDIVDQGPSAIAAYQACFVLGATPPGNVRITGYLPPASDPEFPENDTYPHGGFAKDSANGTDDARAHLAGTRGTKFDAARAAAVNMTRAFVSGFMDDLTPGQRAAILALGPPDIDSARGLSGAGAWQAAAIVATAAVWRAGRRRAP